MPRNLQNRTLLLILALVLLFQSTSCKPGRLRRHEDPSSSMSKTYIIRKALLETTLDYDYGKANPVHDPKKGKPGIGGKP